MSNWKNKVDKKAVGIFVGAILPVVAFIAYWQWKLSDRDWEQLMYFIKLSSDNRNDILVFSLVPNLILFYFSNFQLRLDQFTMGLVGTTLALAIPIVISLVI
ncbi:MAG: hypothetical protein JJT77_08385 [Crocinitomicaceae bacterium]|nr:hypothetical protein [Crocinitomicaceae bacterium]